MFEYLDHDLSGLLDTPEAANQITPALAKSFMMQLVEGVRNRARNVESDALPWLTRSIMVTNCPMFAEACPAVENPLNVV